MAHIVFYTKPGCRGGIMQKQLLISSGHEIEERSILDEKWTPDTLYPYLKGLNVKEWYNKNAVAVKNGTVIPGSLPEDKALELLCSDPLLIKRPLMIVGDKLVAGFNVEYLKELIGLYNIPEEDLTKCQGKTEASICEKNS
ncbi:nitrogenase-associated protein [Clostridium pasteurianum DSM 525 = ATCC 6013]|uniref:Nitrogenase-associated protein n=1 Tax=Clostridium pasteurianum DSM 525 = ATCC 6013 TaxID=1262449 RepID=A0A0H3J5G0_CLOPA|nr:ArsC/Spx/MgsR family protein [Clostridium pasteurianum]AJA48447.1 nitrogenase-associated protein [Clostridium pasteurianum DSM 525 = ATCC 6013]AJA52435.1 nitrogenase-associated protein [Clostridium pasteurianum DSM 525 = ATCC 6013]AOZ75691.1 nitrogenase-associated protein [Clostridium pasteurianum DSM 525 = ATCC 6013]AOZ79487.1 nitrogenase-associated protein [Clostridium pasteurianum]ELP60403.1 nitrogenase-associated protein [Clostridium pasteurianum DSM 525 = ATCC 6013]